ncbi:MAG: undecaprenyl-diphosphate phosphatase [Rhodospirillaceae bacterium]|jgi:undecaprenyl-diphosphatase|nr:undecaprenyl-diphosphate phosphatase [Rhodospirillaceae bacterium]
MRPANQQRRVSVPFIQSVILAAVQGITEFLPVSSSGHLILVPKLTGWTDQGLAIDVAVHVGTLLAVMLYFWRDIGGMAGAIFRAAGQVANRRPLDQEFWLVVKLMVATLPVVAAGYLVNEYLDAGLLRQVKIIGWATLGFGLLLLFADKTNMTIRRLDHITNGGALVIGCFQIFALIPGTSRAGITMTAARFLGVERQDAARFSLLLSIPVIIAAGVLKGWELYRSGNQVLIDEALTVGGLAFLFALLAIAFLMVWLRRASFTPFVVYRVLLGAVLLYIAYGAPGFNLS